jgi:ubiquinone biosynthesis protein UbiJ
MLTERFEAVLNAQAKDSPRARELLRELAGRSITVAAAFTPLVLELRSDGEVLRLSRTPTGDGDAQIRGTPMSLLRLAGADAQAAIRDGSVTIGGDAQIAERFRELAQLLKPDVEDELARLIGDAPAHAIGRIVAGLAGGTRQTARSTARNVYEFLAHERGDIVPRTEGADFLEGVDRLREAADRLAARVAQLESREERP